VAKRGGICWRVATRARSEEGVALVEFALILPVLALLLFGMLDFGKAFNYWIDETHLANEGARWAVVNKNPASAGTLQEYIRSQATTPELRNGGTPSVADPVRVCVEFPAGTSNVGDPVRVTVTATYKWLALIAQRLSVTQTDISGAATMRLEAKPTNYGAGCA
jgi:Flp pilus assembly protein TadG